MANLPRQSVFELFLFSSFPQFFFASLTPATTITWAQRFCSSSYGFTFWWRQVGSCSLSNALSFSVFWQNVSSLWNSSGRRLDIFSGEMLKSHYPNPSCFAIPLKIKTTSRVTDIVIPMRDDSDEESKKDKMMLLCRTSDRNISGENELLQSTLSLVLKASSIFRST